MRNLMLTTALALPLLAGAGFAQTATDDTTTATDPAAAAGVTATMDATTTDSTASDETAQIPAVGTDAEPDAVADGTAPGISDDAANSDSVGMGAAGSEASDMTDTTATDTMDTDATATDAMDPAVSEADVTTTTTTGNDGTVVTTTGDAADLDVTAPVDAMASDSDGAAAILPVGADIVRQQDPNELRVDWITGTSVMTTDGAKVGTINDVIIDSTTGQVKAAIVGVGGFLGIGEKQIAIDWNKLTVDNDARTIMSALTQEEAKAAPAYEFRDQDAAPAAAPAPDAPAAVAPMPADDPLAPGEAGTVVPDATAPDATMPADDMTAPADTDMTAPMEPDASAPEASDMTAPTDDTTSADDEAMQTDTPTETDTTITPAN